MILTSIITPKAFRYGPQYDENGSLIPSSWPPGLPIVEWLGWHSYGMEKGGRFLVDVLLKDEDKSWVDEMPGGWTKNSLFNWDAVGDLVPVTPVDESEYLSHIPDTILYDEEGEPIGTEPAVYHRMHKYQGHPDI